MPRLCAPTTALFAEPDDHVLRRRPEARFLRILEAITHDGVLEEALAYYAALRAHNLRKPQPKRAGRPPSKEAASRRVAAEWLATRSADPVLFELGASNEGETEGDGVGPAGCGGRPPTDFVYLLRAFMGVAAMGLEPEPGMVHTVLVSNPSFARLCGFGYQIADAGRVLRDNTPSLRKLQEYDQVMAEAGLWSRLKVRFVTENLTSGRVAYEEDLVVDTTHYPAVSGFVVREMPDPEPTTPATPSQSQGEAASKVDKPASTRARRKRSKKQRRAVPRVGKRCGCADKVHCTHDYVPTDEGAGVVVKGGSAKKSIWAHKASIMALARSQVPIDAVAVRYAGTHDGTTLVPHLDRAAKLHADVLAAAKRLIVDAAYQSQENQAAAAKRNLKLVAPINPRGTKPKPAGLPGISHFSATGIPVCDAGHELTHEGRRLEEKKHLWGPPRSQDRASLCLSCPLRESCCPGSTRGRTLTTRAEDFPQIDWDWPQHSASFKKAYTKRTAVERVINVLKLDLNGGRLTKRGNASFQARLDKSILAVHLLIKSD